MKLERTKVCSKCKQEKPWSAYTLRTRECLSTYTCVKYPLPACKKCRSEYNAMVFKRNYVPRKPRNLKDNHA